MTKFLTPILTLVFLRKKLAKSESYIFQGMHYSKILTLHFSTIKELGQNINSFPVIKLTAKRFNKVSKTHFTQTQRIQTKKSFNFRQKILPSVKIAHPKQNVHIFRLQKKSQVQKVSFSRKNSYDSLFLQKKIKASKNNILKSNRSFAMFGFSNELLQ